MAALPTDFSPALARLLGRAAMINQGFEKEWDVSFTSTLIAFLASDDPLSRWFQRYVRQSGVAEAELLRARRLNPQRLAEIAAQPLPFESLSNQPAPPIAQVQSRADLKAPALSFGEWIAGQRLTSSSEAILSIAGRLRQTVGGPDEPLDVRHVMGAYIYDPAGHQDDLIKWKFDRPRWSNAFLGQMARLHPGELEGWKGLHRSAFGKGPEIEFEPGPSSEEGPSTHIATDVWTTDDALGYRAYAYAIYRFMTHPLTRPPLTISIQAPWGGGKTSLMRMVQQFLDPDASQEIKPLTHSVEALNVEQVLAELDRPQELPRPQPETSGPPEGRRFTVWFNAWQYESVNQVWAGLVDAIIRQVAARLPPESQERFWLRLNRERIDPDRIRLDLHAQALQLRRERRELATQTWLGQARPWLRWPVIGVAASAAITLIVGWALPVINGEVVGWAGIALTGLLSAAKLLGEFREAQKESEKQATEKEAAAQRAAVAWVREYLDVPDYRAELGFVHRAANDLRRVFESVQALAPGPIVIFVDDLDRCSPDKVAQVVEGINLFLAGDFPACMFVLGMDAEMVAAALEAAHARVVERLPSDASTPIGWRFMDKFVQLPVNLPPAEAGDLERYLQVLLSAGQPPVAEAEALARADELAGRARDLPELAAEAERLAQEQRLAQPQIARVRDLAEARLVQRKVDALVAAFTDDNPEVRQRILAAAPAFSHIPRELKRFVNAFRFQYFLWSARQARGLKDGPSLEQAQRWVVLSMKWP